MQPTKKIKPIRQSILIYILGFALVFVIPTMALITNSFIDESHQQLAQDTERWNQFIGYYVIDDIDAKNIKNINNKLVMFSSNSAIQAIDIYQYNSEYDSISLLTNYDIFISSDPSISNINNRPLKPKISSEQREIYKSAQFENDIDKLLTPIYKKDTLIGYVYIEMNAYQGLSFIKQIPIILVIILVIILILLITLAFILAMRLESSITSPLREISADILHIAQNKDYSFRLSDMEYKEVDLVAKNINNLLNRAERHMTQLGLAEQQSLKLTLELEDKVTSRTQALKESNQELLSTLEQLHQFQDQLVESEKMASLGDMVAGVAHEVNTPIGLGVTASSALYDRLKEIKQAFDDKTLKSSQLKHFLSEGDENVGIIYRNLKRAAELISSFKKVAVDQSSGEFRKFNFSELLNEILLTLAPQIKQTPYNIQFDCEKDLVVVSKPGPINQILINLILNSIAHGFEGREQGNISINVSDNGEYLNITYQDDGCGISETIKDKIFDPFTTTKRGEGGSGLGLHLVYNLVTQALGGNIRLESEADQGATFEINFPVSEQSL